MTRVIGKAPIQLTRHPEVIANSYDQTIHIKTGGIPVGGPFEARAELSVECARSLIIQLRKALHQIRDETRERLDRAVADSEKPLP